MKEVRCKKQEVRKGQPIIVFILTSYFLLLASFVFADTLAEYETAKQNLTSFRAHFVQKKVFTLFEETNVWEGTVWFKQPNNILWHYEVPEESDMVLSGEDAWGVFPETKQVQKVRVAGGNSDRIFQILGFGDADRKLTDSFEVTPGDKEILVLIPKEPSLKAYYSEIRVTLSAEDHLPREVLMKEASGDVTEIILSDFEANVQVEESLFEFKVPEGFQLIDYE